MANILCFDFVIVFTGIKVFMFVYKQNKQNGSSFRFNWCWSGLAQLILLGSALISLDKMQMGSAEFVGSADPARIRSANTFDKSTAWSIRLQPWSSRNLILRLPYCCTGQWCKLRLTFWDPDTAHKPAHWQYHLLPNTHNLWYLPNPWRALIFDKIFAIILMKSPIKTLHELINNLWYPKGENPNLGSNTVHADGKTP